MQLPQGSATAFCPEMSITAVATKGAFALAFSEDLGPIFRTSLYTEVGRVINTCYP